jgi:hypothetical protein
MNLTTAKQQVKMFTQQGENMSKTYIYECFAETLSFAESLGWVDWLDDVDDDTDPDTIDAAEGDAIDYIESKGYVVDYGDSSKNDWPYDQARVSP